MPWAPGAGEQARCPQVGMGGCLRSAGSLQRALSVVWVLSAAAPPARLHAGMQGSAVVAEWAGSLARVTSLTQQLQQQLRHTCWAQYLLELLMQPSAVCQCA